MQNSSPGFNAIVELNVQLETHGLTNRSTCRERLLLRSREIWYETIAVTFFFFDRLL